MRPRVLARGSLPLAGGDLREQGERIEALCRHRDLSVHGLEGSADDHRGVAVEHAFVASVCGRANDDVRDPGLVLERKEDMAFRCFGMLLHDDRTSGEHVAPVTPTLEIARAEHAASREVLSVEAHDLWPGGNTGDAVIERGSLLLAESRKRRSRGGGKRQ